MRAFLIALALSGVLSLLLWAPRGAWQGGAFADFYCAGRVIDAGGNPATIEPLRACEHDVFPHGHPGYAEPAPLPGFALEVFAAFARLPYAPAALGFVALSLGAFSLSGLVLARAARVPTAAAFGSLAVVDYFIDVGYGEVTTLAIGAICAAAWLVERGRDRLAACAAVAAMIEPHVALGTCLALFVWRPRARVALAVAAALAAVLSLAAIGPAGVMSYFARELPLMSRAESGALDQYSLTWLAHAFGASDALATGLGSASYLALLLLGVAAAPGAARRLDAPSLIVLLPCAATALFGVFVHDVQLVAAVPAALVIAARTRAPLVWLALAVLELDWLPWWSGVRTVELLGAFALGSLAWIAFARGSARNRALGIAATVAAYAIAVRLYAHVPFVAFGNSSPWPAAHALGPHDLAALSWGANVRASNAYTATLQLLVGKALGWAALGAILAYALAGQNDGERLEPMPASQTTTPGLPASPSTRTASPAESGIAAPAAPSGIVLAAVDIAAVAATPNAVSSAPASSPRVEDASSSEAGPLSDEPPA